MSRVWFTSDLHIGHEFIAGMRNHMFCPAYQLEHPAPLHDAWLADIWDRTVDKDDTVWVLGDISSGTKGAQYRALQWISERPGDKHLVAGNHDGPFPNNRDAYKWSAAYHDVFESVHHCIRRRIPLAVGHTDVWLSHMPYTDEYTAIGTRGRYPALRLQDYGNVPIVHGHTHATEKLSGSDRLIVFDDPHPGGTLQLHVGVDAWNGALVPLSWIVGEVQAWVGTPATPEREKATQP